MKQGKNIRLEDHLDRPFWFDAINGIARRIKAGKTGPALEKDELIRQIHVMQEMGLGGFFMHSRTGLQTEYLGEEWFELTNVCADEAIKLGMEAWLYDEDRWPSGTAGGMVTKEPRYRMKFLRLRVVTGEEFTWRKYLDKINYTFFTWLESF